MGAPCCPSASWWPSHGMAASGKGGWRWYLAGLEPMPTTVGTCSCGRSSPLAAHHLSLCSRAVLAPLACLRRGNGSGRGSGAELVPWRVELCNLFCNSGGRRERRWRGGGVSSMLPHLGFSVRHTPASVCWRALTHLWRPLVLPIRCVKNPPHARFWIPFYHHMPQFVTLQYQNWGVSNHCVSLLRNQSLNSSRQSN